MNDNLSIGLSAHFSDHSGEIGRLINSKVWDSTPLGSIKNWPASLSASVNICLMSSFPIAIWWGNDLIKIYNDSFRNLLQIKHPESLGTKGENLCPEIWNLLGPSLEGVLKDGNATESLCKLIFPHEGVDQERYFTFFNSPIYDESGEVGGVFTAVSETTQSVLNLKARGTIEASEARLRMAIESSDLGTWDYNPLSGALTWSEKCHEIFGVPDKEKIDFKTFSDHIDPEDKPFVESELRKAMDPDGTGDYKISYRIIPFAGKELRWIKVHGKVYFNSQKQPERVIGTVLDITDEKECEIRRQEYELKMQLTMQASAMGSFEWDIAKPEFTYTDRVAQIFGFEDGKGLTVEDLRIRIHPDDLPRGLEAHEDALSSGVLFYEARVIWPDGSIHWVSVNGRTIFDSNGKPQRIYGTTLDITDSKTQADALEKKVLERTKLLEQINEELKLSEERYFKMTEEVQDYAIILLDKEGTIMNWNKGAEKIKGYTEHQIIGKNFSIFYLEEDRKSNLPERLIQEAQEYGRAMHEGWRKRKDGSKFWGSTVITALHGSKNTVIGFTKVTRDLTERKLAEDTMRQHAAELEIKNTQLEQFAYIASHDLQEPLRKIRTFVQVLEKNINEPGARQKYIHKINASAKRMGELIQSVLNYSRLSQTDELWVTTDLNSVLENVKADYELLIAEKNAIVQSEPLPTIKGITLQLSQLFANLIGNSLKFSHGKPVITISSAILKAGEAQKINSALDNSKSYAELIFKDNGIGFEQHYAEKIFTIFQRLNSREDFMGTGIGLALCKKIVENHEGHIHARSELGKGAEFFVYLPLE